MMEEVEIAIKVNRDPAWDLPEYQYTDRKFLGILSYHEPPTKQRNYDSKDRLLGLGIQITGQTETHYRCVLPDGWTREREGYWTKFYRDGVQVAWQFDKFAYYDRSHFVDFCKSV